MMTMTLTNTQTTGLGMSEHGRLRGADVRALTWGTAASAAFGVTTVAGKSGVQGTGVCGYGSSIDAALVATFPGIPAWSPPI